MTLSLNENLVLIAHPFSVKTLAASLQNPSNLSMLDGLFDKNDLENIELGRICIADDDVFDLFSENALRSEHTTTIKQLKQFENIYRSIYGGFYGGVMDDDDLLELFENLEDHDLPDDTLVTITIE